MASMTIVEIESKDRAWLEVMIPLGVIPKKYHPAMGLVLEVITAPNSGPFRIKFEGNGVLTNLYRHGGTSVIYNNQIEGIAYAYIANYL